MKSNVPDTGKVYWIINLKYTYFSRRINGRKVAFLAGQATKQAPTELRKQRENTRRAGKVVNNVMIR